MLYRVLIALLAVTALGLLWPSRLATGLRLLGAAAAIVALGLLAVVLINLPKAP